MKTNILNQYITKINKLPDWVKQILLMKLSNNKTCDQKEYSFLLHIPELTFTGSEEINNNSFNFDLNIKNFLEYSKNGCTLLDISLNTFLTMEEVAKYFLFCIEQNFIEKPYDKNILITAGYIAGKYLTGEYFLQTGKITKQQLDEAINTSLNSEKKFAQILIEMDLITEQDAKYLIQLKEDATKRLVLDYNELPQNHYEYKDADKKLINEINALKNENKILKDKLTQLLNIVKESV